MIRRGSVAMVLAALVVILMATTAFAHIAFITVDETAELSQTGNAARVTGEIKCTAGEEFAIRVTLTQGDTTARGSDTFRPCEGTTGSGGQDWAVLARVVSGGPLEPGPATACAEARTRPMGGSVDDTESTCEPVTLVEGNGNSV